MYIFILINASLSCDENTYSSIIFAEHVTRISSVFAVATSLHVRVELLHLQRHLIQVVMLSRCKSN